MTRPRPPEYVYRIRYRRSSWNPTSNYGYRYKFTRRSALDYIAKLKRHDPDVSPVSEITLERVPLGAEWEQVEW